MPNPRSHNSKQHKHKLWGFFVEDQNRPLTRLPVSTTSCANHADDGARRAQLGPRRGAGARPFSVHPRRGGACAACAALLLLWRLRFLCALAFSLRSVGGQAHMQHVVWQPQHVVVSTCIAAIGVAQNGEERQRATTSPLHNSPRTLKHHALNTHSYLRSASTKEPTRCAPLATAVWGGQPRLCFFPRRVF